MADNYRTEQLIQQGLIVIPYRSPRTFVMKMTPFQLYVRSLAHGPARGFSMTPKDALVQLKIMTGQDFGFDVERWRELGNANPRVSGMLPPEVESPDG